MLDKLAEWRLRGRKALAVLLDPDDFEPARLRHLLQLAQQHSIDFFLVGGSLVLTEHQAALIALLKAEAPQVPVLLFPSHALHVDPAPMAFYCCRLFQVATPISSLAST